MLRPDLLTLIPIYLWHNDEPYRYCHYSIKVLSNRTLCSDQNSLNSAKRVLWDTSHGRYHGFTVQS